MPKIGRSPELRRRVAWVLEDSERLYDAVLDELARVRAEHKAEIAEVVREVVGLATDPNGPSAEWLQLVAAVAAGEYTPPAERGD